MVAQGKVIWMNFGTNSVVCIAYQFWKTQGRGRSFMGPVVQRPSRAIDPGANLLTWWSLSFRITKNHAFLTNHWGLSTYINDNYGVYTKLQHVTWHHHGGLCPLNFIFLATPCKNHCDFVMWLSTNPMKAI